MLQTVIKPVDRLYVIMVSSHELQENDGSAEDEAKQFAEYTQKLYEDDFEERGMDPDRVKFIMHAKQGGEVLHEVMISKLDEVGADFAVLAQRPIMDLPSLRKVESSIVVLIVGTLPDSLI